MRVLAIAGSLRATSSNAALLRAAGRVAPAPMQVELYDGLGTLPHFSPDLDVDPRPAPVQHLRTLVGAADALVISSPEYAHGVPGSLKNALDWLVSALEALRKPALLVSASPGGAAHAHSHLVEILRTMNLRLIDGGAHVFARSMLDARGDVTDAALLAVLGHGMTALADLVRSADHA